MLGTPKALGAEIEGGDYREAKPAGRKSEREGT
jgi:hypothetical protein